MNEYLAVSKLNSQIKILNYELSKSQKKVKELETSLIKQQKDYADLKVRFFMNSSKSPLYTLIACSSNPLLSSK